MITLHHLRIGRSIFTVWQLEELGVDYQLKVYLRDPDTFRAGDDLKEIHPLGKSPVIEEDGLVISESGAITSYLLEKYDAENRFAPARSDLAAWSKFTQWLHYPEGSVFGPLLTRMILQRSGQEHAALRAHSEKEIALHMDYISKSLGDQDYILGAQFSAADYGVAYVLSMAQRLQALPEDSNLAAYLGRNMGRPAFARAVEKAVE